MTDEMLEKGNQIKSDLKALDSIILPVGTSDELIAELKEWVDKQRKRLEKEFKQLDDIDEFIGYCYVNGISFNYIGSGEKDGRWFCNQVRKGFDDMKEKQRKGTEFQDENQK